MSTYRKVLRKAVTSTVSSNFVTLKLKNLNIFNLVVFTYHWVGPIHFEMLQGSHSLSLDVFEEQIRYVSKHFNVVSLDNVAKMMDCVNPMSNAVAITFDDGYRCIHDYISPVLERYSVPATVFISGNYIDNKNIIWRHALKIIEQLGQWSLFLEELNKSSKNILNIDLTRAELFNLEECINFEIIVKAIDATFASLNINQTKLAMQAQLYLSSNQLQKLNRDIWTIGHHTWSHPFLSSLSAQRQKEEISRGYQYITELSDNSRNYFAIPFGSESSFNAATMEVVDQLGCDLVFSTTRGFIRFPISRPEKRISAPITCMDLKGYLTTLHPDVWYPRLSKKYVN